MSTQPALVVLVGDRDDSNDAHPHIEQALSALETSYRWHPTPDVTGEADLLDAHGIWVVPGSPFQSMNGALIAIRYARESGVPYLGTCAGFQHALIEWARNVLGIAGADDAQSAPDAEIQLITPLVCSLRNERQPLRMRAGSRIAGLYGRLDSEEVYHCCYGLNFEFAGLFSDGALQITAWDDVGAPRAVELVGHPFFIGTLYQPELSSDGSHQHLLIRAFVEAIHAHRVPAAVGSWAGVGSRQGSVAP